MSSDLSQVLYIINSSVHTPQGFNNHKGEISAQVREGVRGVLRGGVIGLGVGYHGVPSSNSSGKMEYVAFEENKWSK